MLILQDQPSNPQRTAHSPTPTPSIEQGRLNFAAYCEACHGPNAQGLVGPNLTISPFFQSQSDQALVNFVKVGRPVDDPANRSGVAMPPKAGFPRLGDDAILSIIVYIRTLSTETSNSCRTDSNLAYLEVLLF